jgi:hypothetical protein
MSIVFALAVAGVAVLSVVGINYLARRRNTTRIRQNLDAEQFRALQSQVQNLSKQCMVMYDRICALQEDIAQSEYLSMLRRNRFTPAPGSLELPVEEHPETKEGVRETLRPPPPLSLYDRLVDDED